MGDVFSLKEQLREAEENLRLIQVRKSKFVHETDIPLPLIKDEQRLESEIARLEAQLAQLAETPGDPRSPVKPDPAEQERLTQLAKTCPYRGLESFEAEHAAFYFGRETMITRLVAKVKDSPFVAIVGPSGCGKSSLVRAGLVTALREGAFPSSQRNGPCASSAPAQTRCARSRCRWRRCWRRKQIT